jgi:hypothetical protein
MITTLSGFLLFPFNTGSSNMVQMLAEVSLMVWALKIISENLRAYLFSFLFWWYWGVNSGPH